MTRLVVSPSSTHLARGTLTCAGRTFACALGRGGVSRDKREGDGATPAGEFPIRRVLYRADRLDAPVTQLQRVALAPHDGWCDAPLDPHYNRPVTLPYPAGAENLWREDHVYDLIVVLGHNDAPPVPHLGSAIFMHVASVDLSPTAGCVALAQEDLLWVLARLAPDSSIAIHAVD
jgi:L,D-peptidoglycan transpeptidase YkuD (ErfK/YbiS/YcfS/YnhG family)